MKETKNIWGVDLPPVITDVLAQGFETKAGFAFYGENSLDEGRAEARPDVILYYGEKLSPSLREKYAHAIFVQLCESKSITGGEGKDYTLSLPTYRGEIISKIQQLCEDPVWSMENDINLGTYNLLIQDKKLTPIVGGDAIPLTDKEVHILIYLYRKKDQMVGRDELLSEVWKYHRDVTTHTLETHIYRLRQKFETLDGAEKLLLTEKGGYKLNINEQDNREDKGT